MANPQLKKKTTDKPNNNNKFQPDKPGVRKATKPSKPPRPCTICSHPQRLDIEAELCNGLSLIDAAARFSTPDHPVKRSSLQRHRQNHLPLHPSERILVPVTLPQVSELPIPEPDLSQDEPEPVAEAVDSPAPEPAAPEPAQHQVAKPTTAPPPPYLAPAVTQLMLGKAQRIAVWQDLQRRCELIMRERGKAHASVPGGRSGLLAVRTVSQRTGKETYETVTVAEFDRALVDAQLRLGEAIAREMGDNLPTAAPLMPAPTIQPVVQIMPGAVANIAIGSDLLPDARHRIRREYTRPAPTVGEIPLAPLSESDLELDSGAVTVIQTGELALSGLAPVLGEARPAGAPRSGESGSGAAAVAGPPIELGEPPATLFDGAPPDES